jgi:hypothetical protein
LVSIATTAGPPAREAILVASDRQGRPASSNARIARLSAAFARLLLLISAKVGGVSDSIGLRGIFPFNIENRGSFEKSQRSLRAAI